MPSAKSKSKKQVDWRYEETVEKIEVIIDQIEHGELDLEQVFDRFTEATTYLKECDQFLNERQEKVELLIETLGDSANQ
ncbi:MAG: exodeoxyribonuclease VII small subunit [Cyanobacteria bacterium P01_F01_bin.42]